MFQGEGVHRLAAGLHVSSPRLHHRQSGAQRQSDGRLAGRQRQDGGRCLGDGDHTVVHLPGRQRDRDRYESPRSPPPGHEVQCSDSVLSGNKISNETEGNEPAGLNIWYQNIWSWVRTWCFWICCGSDSSPAVSVCPPGVFSLNVPAEALFFVGNQLIATSHTGKVGVWNAVTKHWQVGGATLGFFNLMAFQSENRAVLSSPTRRLRSTSD